MKVKGTDKKWRYFKNYICQDCMQFVHKDKVNDHTCKRVDTVTGYVLPIKTKLSSSQFQTMAILNTIAHSHGTRLARHK